MGVGKRFRKKLLSQDKGQKEMVQRFIQAVRDRQSAPIPFDDICAVSMATFNIIESLRSGTTVRTAL